MLRSCAVDRFFLQQCKLRCGVDVTGGQVAGTAARHVEAVLQCLRRSEAAAAALALLEAVPLGAATEAEV
eukprot:6510644-Pyramimonas_sp.AAC.1